MDNATRDIATRDTSILDGATQCAVPCSPRVLRRMGLLVWVMSAGWADGLSAQATSTRPAVTAASDASAMPTSPLLGLWRVTRGTVAPWVVGGAGFTPDTDAWRGRTVRVTKTRVDGPGVLRCDRPTFRSTRSPAEGLFQGGLPAPAETAARALGVATLPVAGVSLTCSVGVFEFHQPDDETMLVAVDNVVWTLDRSPGSLAAPTSPSGVVQRFLERHMAGRMEFDTATVGAKRQFLSAMLTADIRRYFATPSSPDEPPVINGDPFTDSQDYPARFSVAGAAVRGTAATVVVRFSDGYRVYRVRYVLQRLAGQWRIHDVEGQDGSGLRAAMRGDG